MSELMVTPEYAIETMTQEDQDLSLLEELKREKQRKLILLLGQSPYKSVAEACEEVGISKSTYYRWKGDLSRIANEVMPKVDQAELLRFQASSALSEALATVTDIATGKSEAKAADRIKATKTLFEIAAVLQHTSSEDTQNAEDFIDSLGGNSGNVFVNQLNVYKDSAEPGEVTDGEFKEIEPSS